MKFQKPSPPQSQVLNRRMKNIKVGQKYSSMLEVTQVCSLLFDGIWVCTLTPANLVGKQTQIEGMYETEVRIVNATFSSSHI
jgi:hypothetical protein